MPYIEGHLSYENMMTAFGWSAPPIISMSIPAPPNSGKAIGPFVFVWAFSLCRENNRIEKPHGTILHLKA